MRSFMLFAACALAISVGLATGATLDEVDDKPEPKVNQKAVDEIVGMIKGEGKPAAAGEKKGPVGGDWKTKMDEAKRKEEEAKKKALEKQQKYVTETKRTRAQMEKDKKRIISLIEDDKIERKYRFPNWVEPETTTLSPEQLEALRVEEEQLAERRRKYGDWADKEDAKRREQKERDERAKKAQKYSTETKRARAEMERDRERIRDFIAADKGERKHRFVYVEPKPTEMPSEDITTKPPPSECKLTLKFPDGVSKVREYSPREQLAAVRLFVRFQNPSVPFAKIALSKGDKQFTGAMMKESLDSLGLCPTSELDVKLN